MQNPEQIRALQRNVHKCLGSRILHILNGQAMYNIFSANGLMHVGEYISFNEAMCVGKTRQPIFGEAFIKARAQVHHVSREDYEQHVVNPLTALNGQKFKGIVLWFGPDMFCQINLLTILAYLNQIESTGEIIVHLVNEQTYEAEVIEINDNDYLQVYEQVLLQKMKPSVEIFAVLEQGIKLYLQYHQPNNEIVKYIQAYQDLDENALLVKLLSTFPHYGLGDIQYLQLIQSVKTDQP